jgi:hypothetical protein
VIDDIKSGYQYLDWNTESLINLKGGDNTLYNFYCSKFTDVATKVGTSNVTGHAIIQSNGTKSNVNIQNNLCEIPENAFFYSSFSGIIANNKFTTTPSLLSSLSDTYFRNMSSLNSEKLDGIIVKNNGFENP